MLVEVLQQNGLGHWTVLFEQESYLRGDVPNQVERIIRIDDVEFAFEVQIDALIPAPLFDE